MICQIRLISYRKKDKVIKDFSGFFLIDDVKIRFSGLGNVEANTRSSHKKNS